MSKFAPNRQALFLLIAIFAIAINMRPAITSIGPMLDIIRTQLQLSNTQVTLLTAIPVVCMGIFASLAPVLNRIIGLKWSMYIMIFLITSMTALRGFLPGYTVLLITAFIVGFAIAIIGPLLSALIKQYFPQQASGVIGLYSFGMGVGASVSAGLTAVFFEKTSSYPVALSIWAVLGLVGLVSWMLASRNKIIVQQQTVLKTAVNNQSSRSPWKTKKAWLFLLFFGLQSSAFFSVITWLAPIATSSGLTLLQAGSMLSMMTVIQIILNLGFPLLMDKFPARKFWLLVMLCSGIIAIGLLWSGEHSLMWIGAFIMGIPLGGLFPVSLLLPLDETESSEETNSWTAMMQTGGFIIGGIVPLFIATVYDKTLSHHFTFLILITMFLAMIVLTFLIGDKNEQS